MKKAPDYLRWARRARASSCWFMHRSWFTYKNSVGATELKKVWTDPDFDPSLHAFCYARALEIPTPRWTTIQAKQVGIVPPDVMPAVVQERAWASPIWYTPSEEARKAAKPGVKVADLTAKGATALGDEELKALLVGKSIWLSNTVTGEPFNVRYDQDGNALTLHIGKRATLPSEVGNLPKSDYQSVATPYSIKDGKVVTTVAGTPFGMAFYKLGDNSLCGLRGPLSP